MCMGEVNKNYYFIQENEERTLIHEVIFYPERIGEEVMQILGERTISRQKTSRTEA